MGSEKVSTTNILRYLSEKLHKIYTFQLLFRLDQPNGNGDLYAAWQKGSGNYIAITGIDSIVNIFNRYGQLHDRIKLQR